MPDKEKGTQEIVTTDPRDNKTESFDESEADKINDILKATSKNIHSFFTPEEQEELKPLEEDTLIENKKAVQKISDAITNACSDRLSLLREKYPLTQEEKTKIETKIAGLLGTGFSNESYITEELIKKLLKITEDFFPSILNKDEILEAIQYEYDDEPAKVLIRNIERAIEKGLGAKLTPEDHNQITIFYNLSLDKNIPIGIKIRESIRSYLSGKEPPVSNEAINQIWIEIMNMQSTKDYLKEKSRLEELIIYDDDFNKPGTSSDLDLSMFLDHPAPNQPQESQKSQ